jgi:hypothetical protein
MKRWISVLSFEHYDSNVLPVSEVSWSILLAVVILVANGQSIAFESIDAKQGQRCIDTSQVQRLWSSWLAKGDSPRQAQCAGVTVG